MTLFIAGEKTETFTQRSLICSTPVMEAPPGAAAAGSAAAGFADASNMAARNTMSKERRPVFQFKIIAVTGGLCGAVLHQGNGDARIE